MCRFGPCTYVQERLCMRGGSLCVSLLGCTCVAEPRRETLGDTRKHGVSVGRQFQRSRLWAAGTMVMGGAGRGKLSGRASRETLFHKLGTVNCFVLGVWRAQSLSWQRV